MLLVVGVSGSGRTTVARLLADRLGRPHRDADEFHSEANRARMAAGQALTDSDRAPSDLLSFFDDAPDEAAQWVSDFADFNERSVAHAGYRGR